MVHPGLQYVNHVFKPLCSLSGVASYFSDSILLGQGSYWYVYCPLDTKIIIMILTKFNSI